VVGVGVHEVDGAELGADESEVDGVGHTGHVVEPVGAGDVVRAEPDGAGVVGVGVVVGDGVVGDGEVGDGEVVEVGVVAGPQPPPDPVGVGDVGVPDVAVAVGVVDVVGACDDVVVVVLVVDGAEPDVAAEDGVVGDVVAEDVVAEDLVAEDLVAEDDPADVPVLAVTEVRAGAEGCFGFAIGTNGTLLSGRPCW
jgi:hypothetical protein